MNKRIIEDTVEIDVTGGVTFADLTNKYAKLVEALINKYDNVHDIRVTCDSYEYNDGEDFAEELVIRYKRYETNEEYEKRKTLSELAAKQQVERDIKQLKELIEKYSAIAKELIN